jgi:deoxyribodipyrimidine photo-lyase
MRIYNPRKQVRDNDPDGEFIRQYVPELRPLPAQYLDQPEKTPLPAQEEHGVVIGEDYPYPVIDYEAARQRAMDRYERLKPKAREALARPGIARRASLSGQSQPPDPDRTRPTDEDDTHQTELAGFEDHD